MEVSFILTWNCTLDWNNQDLFIDSDVTEMIISSVICFDTTGNYVPEDCGKNGMSTVREHIGRSMDFVGASFYNLCIRLLVSWKK